MHCEQAREKRCIKASAGVHCSAIPPSHTLNTLRRAAIQMGKERGSSMSEEEQCNVLLCY